MGLRTLLRGAVSGGEGHTLAETERDGYEATIGMLQESMSELERQLYEPGWQRLAHEGATEFTREGLRQISQIARFMRAKNPLVRRASAIKRYYVWGQGVEVQARNDTVNEVVSAVFDDESNRQAVFGPDARGQLEQALHTDAHVFLTLFAHPRTGSVQVRPVSFGEIADVITNPEDRADVWYYVRRWTQQVRDQRSGHVRVEQREALHPDVDHRPSSQPGQLYGMRVKWDSPMLRVQVNADFDAVWGVPELYPALDWARAHAEYLDDWRKIVRALRTFAWKAKTKGSNVGAVRKRVAEATGRGDHDEDTWTGTAHRAGNDDARTAGRTWVSDPQSDLQPADSSRQGVSVADVRQFALMVSAATDVPETMLLGDPSTGNLATATTLDRPTELAFGERQSLWGQAYRRIAAYAIQESIRAPGGTLRGTIVRDEHGRVVAEPTERDMDLTVDVNWPSITQHDLKDFMEAIKAGSEAAALPAREAMRLALSQFGVDDVDEILDDMDAQGMFSSTAGADPDLDEAVRELTEAANALLAGAG